MEHLIQFNTTANRRDKWFRLAQYTARLVNVHLSDKGLSALDLVVKLKKFESAVSDSRKLYRIFGSLDFFKKAIDAYFKKNEEFSVRILTVAAHTFKMLWLLHDHFIWLGKIGVYKTELDVLIRRSAWCWLIALVSLVIKDFKQMTDLENRLERSRGAAELETSLKKQLKSVQSELWRDMLDVALPLSTLGRVSAKTGAICGVLSTIMTIKQEWNKM